MNTPQRRTVHRVRGTLRTELLTVLQDAGPGEVPAKIQEALAILREVAQENRNEKGVKQLKMCRGGILRVRRENELMLLVEREPVKIAEELQLWGDLENVCIEMRQMYGRLNRELSDA